MILGLFLAIGESLGDFESKGQLKRLINYNVKKYSQIFDKVYIFSFKNENVSLPKNCQLIGNKYQLHRYLYSLLIPIIHFNKVKECSVLRGLQITGGIPALVAKIILRKKFVINYGYDYSEVARLEGKSLQSLLYKVLEVPILSLADKVIIPAHAIAKKLGKRFKDKIVYIPNGVDTKLFFPPKDKKDSSPVNITFVGRLEKQKNLANLIKAAANFKNAYTLNFYGDGSQKGELTKLSRSLNVPLKISKPLDYENVAKVLRICDIFVLPSYKEGSPKILLEAMSSGCAIMASNIEEISEIIKSGQSGILSDTDQKSLSKSLNELTSPKKRRMIGTNATKEIEKRYNIDRLLEEEVKVLLAASK